MQTFSFTCQHIFKTSDNLLSILITNGSSSFRKFKSHPANSQVNSSLLRQGHYLCHDSGALESAAKAVCALRLWAVGSCLSRNDKSLIHDFCQPLQQNTGMVI
jgi:hypothetical protein